MRGRSPFIQRTTWSSVTFCTAVTACTKSATSSQNVVS